MSVHLWAMFDYFDIIQGTRNVKNAVCLIVYSNAGIIEIAGFEVWKNNENLYFVSAHQNVAHYNLK